MLGDKKILIAGALGAAYLLYNIKDLRSKLEKQGVDFDKVIIDIDDSIDNKLNPNKNIKENITIEPLLRLGNCGISPFTSPVKWSARMTWIIKNNSTQYTYVITGIKSILTIDGHTCSSWMPGNTDTFLTLKPGASGEITSDMDDICMYENNKTREEIVKHYVPGDCYSPGLVQDPQGFPKATQWQSGLEAATYLRVQSEGGTKTTVSYGRIPGKIRRVYWAGTSIVHFYPHSGQNMSGTDL